MRRHAEEKMALLDRLGHASSKADEGAARVAEPAGWEQIPSSARADKPLPRQTSEPLQPSWSRVARAASGARSPGGSRGTAPKRVAIGYLRNDDAAEETAEELRAARRRAGARPRQRRLARASRRRSPRSARSTRSSTARRPA